MWYFVDAEKAQETQKWTAEDISKLLTTGEFSRTACFFKPSMQAHVSSDFLAGGSSTVAFLNLPGNHITPHGFGWQILLQHEIDSCSALRLLSHCSQLRSLLWILLEDSICDCLLRSWVASVADLEKGWIFCSELQGIQTEAMSMASLRNFHKNKCSVTLSCYCSSLLRLHTLSLHFWAQWGLQYVIPGQLIILCSQNISPLPLHLPRLPSVQSPSASPHRRAMFFTQSKRTVQCHGLCGEQHYQQNLDQALLAVHHWTSHADCSLF